MRLYNTVEFKLPIKTDSVIQKTREPIGISNSQIYFSGKRSENGEGSTGQQSKNNRLQNAANLVGVRDESDAELGGYYLIASMIAACIEPLFAVPPLIAGIVTVIQDARGANVKKKPDSQP